jgi:hypothetical protein
MSRRLLVLATLLLIPTIASAQRRGGGGFGRDQGATYGGPGNMPGLQLSNRDVEDISPLKLLIDKRKDLQLADDKLKELKDLESQLKEKIKPAFKVLDSLRRESRGSGRGSDEDRSKMMSARDRVMSIVAEIRVQYDAAFKEALPLLDEAQQKTANELAEKQHADAEEMLKEKLGGRGGGRRG